MKSMRHRGFTLIELMIGLAIFAFLIMVAGPQYADFLGNSQIRNGAENTLTGLRLAQTEAIRGNTQAQFVLDPSATGGWQVLRLNEDTAAFDIVIQSYKWTDGAAKTTVTPNPSGATEATFSGLGRITDNPDASNKIKWIEVTNTNITTPRKLRVAIDPVTATGVKLCDPGVTDTTDPRFCPTS